MDIDEVKGIAQVYMSMQEKKKDDEEFKPHMMYDPKTGKAYKAEKPEDHERMKKMGYTHDDPKTKAKEEDASNDKSDDGEGMDKVDKKALKKKFKDRKDKDIDNDGDTDDSDEYLHKKRQAVSKAINDDKRQFVAAAKAAKEKGEKKFTFAGKEYDVKEALDEDKQMYVYHIRDVTKKEGNVHARSKMEAQVKAKDNGYKSPMSVIMKGPYVAEETMNEDKKSHAASPKADMVEPETDGKNAKSVADKTKEIMKMHKKGEVKDYPADTNDYGDKKMSKSKEPKTLKDVRK